MTLPSASDAVLGYTSILRGKDLLSSLGLGLSLLCTSGALSRILAVSFSLLRRALFREI